MLETQVVCSIPGLKLLYKNYIEPICLALNLQTGNFLALIDKWSMSVHTAVFVLTGVFKLYILKKLQNATI